VYTAAGPSCEVAQAATSRRAQPPEPDQPGGVADRAVEGAAHAGGLQGGLFAVGQLAVEDRDPADRPLEKLLKSRVPMRTGASPRSGVMVGPPVADWSSRSLSRGTPSR
jgi:hypothetical protein